MANEREAVINRVVPGSIADKLKIIPGDRLLRINQNSLRDFIDYLMFTSQEKLELDIKKQSGARTILAVKKRPEEPLGISFSELVFDGLQTCSNHCLFCFVHQMPPQRRPSLYIQDDDYRLSFLQGGYITLTNLTEEDLARIINLKLSPLYISVHATNPKLRQKLLGNKRGGEIMEQLRRLAEAGISMHTQAVICPGINDGQVLAETIYDLAGLWPQIESLAIVPVGLTAFRQNLYPLRLFQQEEASQALETIHTAQVDFLESLGSRFVFGADELYLQAKRNIPENEAYEDYLQLDNGVGLIRWFLTEFTEELPNYETELAKLPATKLVIITGIAAKAMWQDIKVSMTKQFPHISWEILGVENRFFGREVTVTGLLTGSDISACLENRVATREEWYLIPQIALRQNGDLFLDDLSFEELCQKFSDKKLVIAPNGAMAWLEWLCKTIK